MHRLPVGILFRNATFLISVESESEEESVASDDKVEDPEKVSGTFVNSTVTIALRCPYPSFTLVVLPPHIRVWEHLTPIDEQNLFAANSQLVGFVLFKFDGIYLCLKPTSEIRHLECRCLFS